MPPPAHRILNRQQHWLGSGSDTQLADQCVLELGRGLASRREANDIHAIAWSEPNGMGRGDFEADAVIPDEHVAVALHRHDTTNTSQRARVLRKTELQQTGTGSQRQVERVGCQRALNRGLVERRRHELDAHQLPPIVEDRAADATDAQMPTDEIGGCRDTRRPRDDDAILVRARDERELYVDVVVGEPDILYESIGLDPGAVEPAREQLVEGDALWCRQCPVTDDADPRFDHHRRESAAGTEAVDLHDVARLEFRGIGDVGVHVDSAGGILDEEVRPGWIVVRDHSAKPNRIALFGRNRWQAVNGCDCRQELHRSLGPAGCSRRLTCRTYHGILEHAMPRVATHETEHVCNAPRGEVCTGGVRFYLAGGVRQDEGSVGPFFDMALKPDAVIRRAAECGETDHGPDGHRVRITGRSLEHTHLRA